VRSLPSPRVWLLAAAIALGAPQAYGAPGEPPSRRDVQSAADRVAKDPNLASKVMEKTLRLKPGETKAKKDEKDPGLKWLVEFMRWLSETARWGVWFAGALAVALLLVGLRRWMRERDAAVAPRLYDLPSHVQSLDIRPESLPDDVGQASAALWQQGQQRAALSLLYRGALSRVVHDHAVLIRAASTEGECLVLATNVLDKESGAFFTRLVRAWQLAVYGARMPTAEQALQLCRDFGVHLQPQRPAEAAS